MLSLRWISIDLECFDSVYCTPIISLTHARKTDTTPHTAPRSVGLLALEQHAEKTAAEGVVNLYNFCAGLSLIVLGVLYFVMVRACVRPMAR